MDSLTSRHKLTLNREGFESEHNDCSVRAIQNVTGVPYVDAHRWAEIRGRKNRRGTPLCSWLDMVTMSKELVYGYRLKEIARPKYKREQPTLAQVMWKLRQGRYLVVVTGHAFAVIDGVIHDQGHNGARKRVLGIWQFEPSSVVEAREREQSSAAPYASTDRGGEQ